MTASHSKLSHKLPIRHSNDKNSSGKSRQLSDAFQLIKCSKSSEVMTSQKRSLTGRHRLIHFADAEKELNVRLLKEVSSSQQLLSSSNIINQFSIF